MAVKKFDININEESPTLQKIKKDIENKVNVDDLDAKLKDKQDKIDLDKYQTKLKHDLDVFSINRQLTKKADITYVDEEIREVHKITNKKFEIVDARIDEKQDILVDSGSRQNIKTINNNTIIGVGDLKIIGKEGPRGPRGPKGDSGDSWFDEIIANSLKDMLKNSLSVAEIAQVKELLANSLSVAEIEQLKLLLTALSVAEIAQLKLLLASFIEVKDDINNMKKILSECVRTRFTEDEFKKIKALLDNTAFAINERTKEIYQTGFFTRQAFLSDLKKPKDNMITDDKGKYLDVDDVFVIHYSGVNFYKEFGKGIGVRYYQDKFTYNNKEVLTRDKLVFSDNKNDISDDEYQSLSEDEALDEIENNNGK